MHLDPPRTETATVNPPDALISINASIAAMDVVQATIVEKLAVIGRAIGTVQFDLTWVRDDVRGLQNGMQKLAESVCEMRGAHMEVERLREKMSPRPSARPSGIEALSAMDCGKSNAASLARANQLHRDKDEDTLNPVCEDDVASIEETQFYDNTADVATNIQPPAKAVGGTDWLNETQMSIGMCSPMGAQTRTSMYVVDQDDETQECEDTFPANNTRTPAGPRSMWTEFTTAVRDLPAPIGASADLAQGWVGAKRARMLPVGTPEQTGAMQVPNAMVEALTLNLNLPPEKHTDTEGGRDRGKEAMPHDVGATSRGHGRGSGRGRGRGRRPPPVQPRYHAAVSSGHTTTMQSAGTERIFLACHEIERLYVEHDSHNLLVRG